MRFLIISSRVFLVFSAETFSIWLFHKLLASHILLGNEEWSKNLSGTLPPARSFNWAVSQFVTGYILLWLQWFCCIEIVATEKLKGGKNYPVSHHEWFTRRAFPTFLLEFPTSHFKVLVEWWVEASETVSGAKLATKTDLHCSESRAHKLLLHKVPENSFNLIFN